MKLTCNGCIDYNTCLLDERKKNKRCEYYTRAKEETEVNYAERHIKNMEKPYDPSLLDEIIPMNAIERIRGKRKRIHRYED